MSCDSLYNHILTRNIVQKCTLDCTQELGKCQMYFHWQTCNTFHSSTFWHNMRTVVIKAVLKHTAVVIQSAFPAYNTNITLRN